MIVKILGAIDLAASIAFLMLTFSFQVPVQFLVFCAGLLFLKGMFIFGGEVLSIIDLIASACLILSIWFTLPILLLWIPAFLLLAKGFVSLL